MKLLKYWNAERLEGKLASYFIELAIAKAFWDKGINHESVSPLSYGVALAFWALRQAVARGAQEPWILSAPPVYPGTLLAGHLIRLRSDTDLGCAAWDDEKAGSTASASAKWKRVFGDKFPD